MFIRKIGRRIYTITCEGQHIENDEFKPFTAVVHTTENLPTLEALTKHLRKRENDQTIVINKVDVAKSYYKMPVQDFIMYAERTD